ncbi:hypothetical protein FNH07_35225 [Amycolatopsis bartoniae]|nr:hypothetical protein FNH07_35225 [Amycolatopsis bartoniae]
MRARHRSIFARFSGSFRSPAVASASKDRASRGGTALARWNRASARRRSSPSSSASSRFRRSRSPAAASPRARCASPSDSMAVASISELPVLAATSRASLRTSMARSASPRCRCAKPSWQARTA